MFSHVFLKLEVCTLQMNFFNLTQRVTDLDDQTISLFDSQFVL